MEFSALLDLGNSVLDIPLGPLLGNLCYFTGKKSFRTVSGRGVFFTPLGFQLSCCGLSNGLNRWSKNNARFSGKIVLQ